MLQIITSVQTFLLTRAGSWTASSHAKRRQYNRGHSDRGQATAEYALVLLAAATIALVLIAWATKSGRIGRLFDSVFDAVTKKIS